MRHAELEQHAERQKLLSALLRFVAAVAIAYYIVVSGGFARSAWTGVACAVAIVATMASVALTWAPARNLWSLIIRITMVVSGGLVTALIGVPGWIVLGVGAVNIIGIVGIDLWIGVLAVAAGGVPIVVGAVLSRDNLEQVLLTLCSVVGIGVVGYSRRLTRVRRAQEQALVERSRQLEQRSLEVIEQTERARTETARVAALEERARIARDLHDVLAHSLGGLVVQLEAADAVLSAGGDREQVAARVRTSRRLAVDGLQEARAAVRELRADQDGPGADEGASEDTAQLDVVDAVLGVVRGPVGIQLRFDLDVVGQRRPVPATVAAVFAAVARESLTNINKHGSGRSAGSLIFTDDTIRLEMINAVPTSAEPERAGLADTGGGYGLSGMHRRLSDIGGTLTAGRRGDRWVVSALWPATTGPEDDHVDAAERDDDRAGRSTRGNGEV
ncbi:ATP-binding protein [Microlunatus soli]|uniref:histidine kinase n=1 Tax=Microlunatus soli TaxID=630515 RepID=A0A1H1PBF8_9ACTN|nr:histidine kinase [Microlunatus soli]SDS08552.1 Signal transduction histidine kinase [Microlunatus soli]